MKNIYEDEQNVLLFFENFFKGGEVICKFFNKV